MLPDVAYFRAAKSGRVRVRDRGFYREVNATLAGLRTAKRPSALEDGGTDGFCVRLFIDTSTSVRSS